MRPSVTRANARFRGPTDTETYTNIFNEINHDIKYLFRKSVGYYKKNNNSEIFVIGHKFQIINDLTAAVDGVGHISHAVPLSLSPMEPMHEDMDNIIKKVNILESELIQWNSL
ncbi:MAG TPA: hypothetical protein VK190_02985 [Pseudoneobacillus sp.]|jgi:hypothetical protein|nr:hypothetical protein [Pseudoneobacillus sp.]